VALFPLLHLDQTFRFLSGLLVAGAAAHALLGVALGMRASKRALRPLRDLTSAAAQIAGRELSARLPRQADADLAPLATTFNATADAVEQRDARFASDVSHELRSPLTTLLTVAEVLHHGRTELPDRLRQAVEMLAPVLRGFQRMAVDLLEISSTDQDAEDLALEPVDLLDVVGEVLATCPDIHVPVDHTASPPLVLGDAANSTAR
jgi:signal transduction histidine kinase